MSGSLMQISTHCSKMSSVPFALLFWEEVQRGTGGGRHTLVYWLVDCESCFVFWEHRWLTFL